MQKKTKVILLVVFLSILLFFGGCAALFWFGWTQLKGQVTSNPVVVETLGEIEECSLDLEAMGNSDSDHLIFKVRGPKGSGVVVVDPESLGEGHAEGTLEVDGKTYDLGN